jgi:type VI secretion system secreted protein VgrG
MCETTGHNKNVIVQKDYKEQIDGSYSSTVKGDYKAQVSGTVSLTSDSDQHYQTSANYAIDATQSVHVKGGSNVFLEAASSLSLKVGGNFINLNPGGIFISGTMVGINSGGSAGQGAGCAPDKPDLPAEAGKGVPGGRTPTPRNQWSKGARSLSLAAQSGAAFCDP